MGTYPLESVRFTGLPTEVNWLMSFSRPIVHPSNQIWDFPNEIEHSNSKLTLFEARLVLLKSNLTSSYSSHAFLH